MNIYAISLTVVVKCKVLSFIPNIFTSSMLLTVTGTVTLLNKVLFGYKWILNYKVALPLPSTRALIS